MLPEITYGNDCKEVHRVNGSTINQNEVAAKSMTGRGLSQRLITMDWARTSRKARYYLLKARHDKKLSGGLYIVAKYNQAKYAEPAEAYGSFAFAAATPIMDAIEKVGLDRKKVRDALSITRDADTIIGKVTFDDRRQNIVPLISKYVV